mgnify:CR=1 FL=1
MQIVTSLFLCKNYLEENPVESSHERQVKHFLTLLEIIIVNYSLLVKPITKPIKPIKKGRKRVNFVTHIIDQGIQNFYKLRT